MKKDKQFVLIADDTALKKSQGFRKARLGLADLLHEVSGDKRLRWCGYGAVNNSYITIRLGLDRNGNKRAGACGVIMCGRVWTCPVCSYKIANQRNDDLVNTFRVWKEKHGTLLFITFTLSHSKTMPLDKVWRGLDQSWKYMLNGKAWNNFSIQYGAYGFVRATELTHGSNGWHTHYHTALFVEKGFDSEKNIKEIREYLSNRWITALGKNGFSASASIGVDLRRTYSDSGLSRYLNKFANEITKGQVKTAKKQNRTPFAILQDIKDSKDFEGAKTQSDLSLWWEFERVSKGKRQLVISKKVRSLVALTPINDIEDDYIIAPVNVLTISSNNWVYLKQRKLLSEFYNLLETTDFASVLFWLSDNQIAYRVTSATTQQEYKELLNA